ncbi:putative glycine betaine transporter [Tubulanus polymorphus]|uniref:putative glycine betaine transporter n=1 Tax=Tubulanus polymorphus TaxID=672921 RepID=UPI003DA34A64
MSHGHDNHAVVIDDEGPDDKNDSQRNGGPVVIEDKEPLDDACGCQGMYGGCFQTCFPDPDQTDIIAYDSIKDRSCWFRIPKIWIRFNPIVTCAAIVFIWGFVIFCMLEPKLTGDEFKKWKVFITKTFTWLYVGSQDIWALFIVVVYVKYGHVKLGKDDDEPEYGSATWFTMLFACGIGVGLFFFGVAEPVWHYVPEGGGNRYISDKSMPDNTLAQIAINLTLYHWGIHGWVVYCVMGMLMGIVSYRMGLPMTVKSCFYPLLGDKIFGWMGDAIDALSIITTLFGVCTSLGLGTIQLNTGLNLINPDIPISRISQIIIIWGITLLATASTLSGIGLGIRRLSELCFGVGMVIMLIVLFLDNTWYIMNLYTQSIGFYFQWLLQLGFHCDAFELAGKSHGGADRNRGYPDGESDGPELWMDWWTIFYWGWWIAWSPFVGMFIAKISKGRTVREFVNGTMTAPIIYAFFWMVIFGGIGIKMEREAAGAGLCCGHNLNVNITTSDPNVGQPIGNWLCVNSTCNPCSNQIINRQKTMYSDSSQFIARLNALNNIAKPQEMGVQLEDKRLTRLSCHSKEQMWFDVMDSYGSISGFLRIFSIIAIILYFVTSSDSGSYVIDCLAANGDKEPPRIQRVFWAFSEGATASALIWVGGKDALSSLQTVSVAAGLPFTIVICFACVALWRVLEVEGGNRDPYGPQFKVGMFDVLARPNAHNVIWVMANIFIAPYTFATVLAHTSNSTKKQCITITYTIFMATFMLTFLILVILGCIKSLGIYEVYAIGCVFLFAFCTVAGASRISMRTKYSIDGNMIEDMFCSIMYPMLAYQLSETMKEHGSSVFPGEFNDDGDEQIELKSK